jgi:hypothetical protein
MGNENTPVAEVTSNVSSKVGERIARKRPLKNYEGSKALPWPELEEVAQFLSTPKDCRTFKTVTDLATTFGVTRMTIYRWTKHPDVLTRADYLLRQHQERGDLIARLFWDKIVRGQVQAAMKGDTKAALFCERRAWPT